MKPPYIITPAILHAVSAIAEKVGAIREALLEKPRADLRKENRVKTIHASLAIEGNAMDIEQVTAVLENQRVLARPRELQEIRNAIKAYNRLDRFQADDLNSFLQAHRIMMKYLIRTNGMLRTGASGVIKGSHLEHVAPPAKMLNTLMNDLFTYLKNSDDPLLIKSCVFHYELEFIHPFEDGNGRMGRLWQTVILMKYNPVFAYLPAETVIKKRQAEYYKALSLSDKAGQSAVFIEFMLSVLDESLSELLKEKRTPLRTSDRMDLFRSQFNGKTFSRQDYLKHFKGISPATASRDLKEAVTNAVLVMEGNKRTAVYRFA